MNNASNRCGACDGRGTLGASYHLHCRSCDGTGVVPTEDLTRGGFAIAMDPASTPEQLAGIEQQLQAREDAEGGK